MGLGNNERMTKKPMHLRLARVLALPFLIAGLLLTLPVQSVKAQPVALTNLGPLWVFTVRISATVQTSPPRINLTWASDPDSPGNQYTVNTNTIYRKTKEATSWTKIAALSGSANSFTDTSVAAGSAYEYSIIKSETYTSYTATNNFTGDGYIFSGINAPLTEGRGKLILLVESSVAGPLASELARLQSDLVGDGWTVLVHTVSRDDSPANAKSLIVADYNADPANVKAVFLFGHIPIFMSGNLNYDGHFARPMPADSYYGDMDGDWSSLPDYIPSDIELMVGRVDFFDMPGIGAASPWPNETELLRNYLNKDHNWRFKLINVQKRALVADRFGTTDVGGEPKASTSYRNFEPLLGHDKIVWADCWNTDTSQNRWISLITAPGSSYLWTYACGGGGDYNTMSEMGTNAADYHNVYSKDIVARDPKCVFFMLEGSHFGNWEKEDNLLRSVLAQPTMGLAVCCIAGHPHWYVHHMGLGETIGYGARLTMNNLNLYSSWSNTFPRAIYITLLGDPSLRMDPLAPPSTLTATPGSTTVAVHWTASPDSVVGYHVYRAASAAGPFTRLNGSLVTGTSFTDTSPPAGSSTYMVRAVALQTTASGSYYNPSQGIFASANSIGSGCTYALSGTSTNLTAAGGTGSVQMIADANCDWTAVNNDSWFTVTSGSSGTGNGTVRFMVASNATLAARTGTLGTTAGTFTINQDASVAAACTYALSATSVTLGAASGPGSVNVIAGAGCDWTAVSNDPWITITSGTNGTGTGAIHFMVSSNSDTIVRIGSLGTTAGIFFITQNPAGSGNPTNSLDEIKGTYTGLFFDPAAITQESSGYFSATIGKKGRASVRLQVGGKSYSFSTTFDESGSATYTLRHGASLVLETDLQVGALGSDTLGGTISGATWTAVLSANRSVFSAANPCPNAGKYTLIIPGDTSGTPSLGDGYASATVNFRGGVSVAGSLADGTRFSQAATVSGNGQWPLYVALYSRGGSILGWLTFADTGTDDLSGPLSWIKPAMPKAKFFPDGLTITTAVSGSHYTPPTSGQSILNFSDALLAFNTGNPSDTGTNHVTIGAHNVVTDASSNKRVLTFTPSTGSFRGQAVNPTSSAKTSFSGVVLQKQQFGAGYFLKTDKTSGQVLLLPAQ